MPAGKMMLLVAAALFGPAVASKVPLSCTDTGFYCSAHKDGETDYCERWASNSVCVNGKCQTPASCFNDDDDQTCVKGSAGNTCRHACDNDCDEPRYCEDGTDTYDCKSAKKKKAPEAKKKKCVKGSDGDTCLFACDGACDEPSLCSKGTDSSDCGGTSGDGASGGSGVLGSMAELVRVLMQEDVDDEIPERFTQLVSEVKKDEESAVGVTSEDFANIMGALGYDKPTFLGDSFRATIDHELVAGNKLVCHGSLREESASIQACFNSYAKASKPGMLRTVNEWNDGKRLSTAFVDSDSAPCLQSDLHLTSYEKANVQLTQRFLSTFAVSAKVFHLSLHSNHHDEL